MKLINHFNDFLNDTVNLNQSRLDLLEKSSNALETFVTSSDWVEGDVEWYVQGSWKHQTIIRPNSGKEFDADILAIVHPQDGWSAKDYIENLYREFKNSDTYKNKVKRSSHCVTIEYAGERRVDIAPCVRDRYWMNTYEVCNRSLDEFEKSSPKAYTDWLIQRNSWSSSNSFRKCTRLVKYLRDIKTTFSCSSVCLTTLLAEQVYESDHGASDFADVPTTLRTLFERLDIWLKIRPTIPRVENPTLSEEDFSNCWTQETYENFRNKIQDYREWIDDAYNEEDKNKSISKWRRVFGKEFAKSVDIEEAKAIEKSAFRGHSIREALMLNLADALSIGRKLANLPYLEIPKWRNAPIEDQQSVIVSATRANKENGIIISELTSAEPISKFMWIRFSASTRTGLPFARDVYDVHWRVANTGEEAASNDALRGSFENSNIHNQRWEKTEYAGFHIVEAYVVLKRTGRVIGVSEPFVVNIE